MRLQSLNQPTIGLHISGAVFAAFLTMACGPGEVERITATPTNAPPVCVTRTPLQETVCDAPVNGVQQCRVQYNGQVTCAPVMQSVSTCVPADSVNQ